MLAVGLCVSRWIVCKPVFFVTEQQEQESRILGVRIFKKGIAASIHYHIFLGIPSYFSSLHFLLVSRVTIIAELH